MRTPRAHPRLGIIFLALGLLAPSLSFAPAFADPPNYAAEAADGAIAGAAVAKGGKVGQVAGGLATPAVAPAVPVAAAVPTTSASKTVVIFYSDTGAGHVTAARGLQARILAEAPDTKVILKNIWDFTPKWAPAMKSLAWKMALQHFPSLRDKGYTHAMNYGNAAEDLADVRRYHIAFNKSQALQFLAENHADTVIAANYSGAEILRTLRQEGHLENINTGWIFTDYAEGYWPRVSQFIDKTFLTHPALKDTFVARGVPESKLAVTGLPLNPKLFEPADRAAVLGAAGMKPEIKTIVVTGGSDGAAPFRDIVNGIVAAEKDKPLQIIVVCGRNASAQKELAALAAKLPANITLKATGLVPAEQLLDWIKISDTYVAKAGGLSPTEGFAVGRPMVIYSAPGGGVEQYNVNFFAEQKLAAVVQDPKAIGGAAVKLLHDPAAQAEIEAAQKVFRDNLNTRPMVEFALQPKPMLARKGVKQAALAAAADAEAEAGVAVKPVNEGPVGGAGEAVRPGTAAAEAKLTSEAAAEAAVAKAGEKSGAAVVVPITQGAPAKAGAQGAVVVPPAEARDAYTKTEGMLMEDERLAMRVRTAIMHKATKKIDFLTFILRADDVGLSQLWELRDAARRGVKVRLLLDDQGARKISDALRKHLIQEGVDIKVWHKRTLTDLANFHRRMHDKHLAVDGDEIVNGGRNAQNAYYGQTVAQNRVNFDDVEAYVRGKDAATSDDYFDKMWSSPDVVEVKPEALKVSPFDVKMAEANLNKYSPAHVEALWGKSTAEDFKNVVPIKKFRVVSAPVGTMDYSSGVSQDLLKIIRGAEHDVTIISPYMILPDEFMEAIQKAREKNVAVTIITNSKTSNDNFLISAAYRNQLPKLKAMGVEVREYGISFMLHTKIVYRDGGVEFYVGSYNIDPRSHRLNTESGVVIEGETDFIKQVRKYAENVVKLSDPVAGPGAPAKLARPRCVDVLFQLLVRVKALRNFL